MNFLSNCAGAVVAHLSGAFGGFRMVGGGQKSAATLSPFDDEDAISFVPLVSKPNSEVPHERLHGRATSSLVQNAPIDFFRNNCLLLPIKIPYLVVLLYSRCMVYHAPHKTHSAPQFRLVWTATLCPRRSPWRRSGWRRSG